MVRKLPVYFIVFFLLAPAFADEQADKAAIEKTNAAVRAAFAHGDIPGILAYHHPDITKALAYDSI